jgi:hypothetical protein
MMKRRLLNEVIDRIKDLNEAQLEAWIRGHVSLMDAVIDRYGEALLDHRELALSVIRIVSVDEVRDRLLEARPEFTSWWDSSDFDRAFERETDRILMFLGEAREGEGSEEGPP